MRLLEPLQVLQTSGASPFVVGFARWLRARTHPARRSAPGGASDPEFIAGELAMWCEENLVDLWFIEPGKPDQNAFIERFNRSYREEVLDAYLFEDLSQVREISHEWLISYNEERPHDALGSLPPALFRQQVMAARSSTSELST